jgi:SHAQKYF class myb-like DNA-binding protein
MNIDEKKNFKREVLYPSLAFEFSQVENLQPSSPMICEAHNDDECDNCIDQNVNISELSTISDNLKENDEKWNAEDHRAFVSQIFDLGIQNASPCLILENMKCTDPYFVTKARVKSHLQKYRLVKARSKEEFLDDYDKCMKRGIENMTIFKEKSGCKRLISKDEIDSFLDSEVGLGKVGATLSIACMIEDHIELNEEELELNVNDSPKKVSDLLALDGIISIPTLTEEEKKSPLGMMMLNIVACFHSIQECLEDKKQKDVEAFNFQEFQKDFLKGHSRQNSDTWMELEDFCNELDMPLKDMIDDPISKPICFGKSLNMIPFPTSRSIVNCHPADFTAATESFQRFPPLQWSPPWIPMCAFNPFHMFQIQHRILNEPNHMRGWIFQDTMSRIQAVNSRQNNFSSQSGTPERYSQSNRRNREEDVMNSPPQSKRMRHPDPNYEVQTGTVSHFNFLPNQDDRTSYVAQGFSYSSKEVDKRFRSDPELSFGISINQHSHFPVPLWVQESTKMPSHPSLTSFHSAPINSFCVTPDLGCQNESSAQSVSLDDDSSIPTTI